MYATLLYELPDGKEIEVPVSFSFKYDAGYPSTLEEPGLDPSIEITKVTLDENPKIELYLPEFDEYLESLAWTLQSEDIPDFDDLDDDETDEPWI